MAWCYTISPPGWDPGVPLIRASPVVVDTFVYIPACDGKLYCLSLISGDSLWAADICDDLRSTPAVNKSCIYVLGDEWDKKVHCLNASNGGEIWSSDTLGGAWEVWSGRTDWIDSSPVVVADSLLFVGVRNGYAYCLDTADGSVRWSTQLGSYVTSSPAVVDTCVLIGGSDHAVDRSGFYCLHAATGDTLWYYHYDNGNAGGTMSSPTVVGEYVYVGLNSVWRDQGFYWDQGGVVACFAVHPECEEPPPSACSVEPLWAYGIQCDVRGTPVVIDTLVYVSTGRGLYGLDVDVKIPDSLRLVLGLGSHSGIQQGGNEETWESIGASCRYTVAEAETLLFVGGGGNSAGGGCYCLDRELNTLWSYQTDGQVWTSPAIAKGRVVMGDFGGNIYCFIDDESERAMPNPGHALLSALERPKLRPVLAEGQPASALSVRRRHARVEFVLDSAHPQQVSLALYDPQGRLVRTLLDRTMIGDRTLVTWSGESNRGSRTETGVYFYRLKSAENNVHGAIWWLR